MAKEQPQTPFVDAQDTAPTGEVVTQDGEKYTSTGSVVLRTRAGHQFAPSDKSLPVVTDQGVNYSRENADKILDEASFMGDGYITEVKDEG